MTTQQTLIPAPVLVPNDLQPILDEQRLSDGSTFGKFNVTHLVNSPTNRKRFSQQALEELAASVGEKGVAQPILIRPLPVNSSGIRLHEIIAGERRWRASVIAGLTHIPALCRELSDHDAIELQILENLQREDPHPLEEAEGYERLMLTHGYTADQLAQRLKKSRTFIYNRLKLCRLSQKVRDFYLDGKFDAAVAELLARLPSPEMQFKAAREVANGDDPMSVRQAREHLRRNYTVDLKSAVFSLKDANLVASSGSCDACPNRTGNQADRTEDDKNGNICTLPACFREKEAAHQAKQRKAAEEKGAVVIRQDETSKFMSYGSLKKGYSDLDKTMYLPGGKQTTYRKLLGKNAPAGMLIEDYYAKGKFRTIAKTSELEELVKQHAAGTETDAAREAKSRDREKQQERAAVIERKYRRDLFRAVHAAGAPATAPFDAHEVAALLYRNCPSDQDVFICELHGWTGPEYESGYEGKKYVHASTKIANKIRTLPLPEAEQLIRDMTMVRDLSVNTYSGAGERPERLLAAAAAFGIDATAIRAALVKEAKDKEAAKQKKKVKAKKSPAPAQGDLLSSPAKASRKPAAKKAQPGAATQSPADLLAHLTTHPEALDALTTLVVDREPHRLAELEKAAAAIGMTYNGLIDNKHTWTKLISDEVRVTGVNQGAPATDETNATTPTKAEPNVALAAPESNASRKTLSVSKKPQANADAHAQTIGPVVKVKKSRVAAVSDRPVIPAGMGWPFPTSGRPKQ